MTIFKIITEQALDLVLDARDHERFTETRPWARIELGYEAIERDWLQRFKPNWIDLPILLAIGLHARPLIGADFKMLVELGLAQATDEGRLYTRITDTGLADILGCSRYWISGATARLSAKGLLRAAQLPKYFQDSRGKFAGTEAYILPGEVLIRSTPDNIPGVNLVRSVISGVNSVGTANLGVNSVDTAAGHNGSKRELDGPTGVNLVGTKDIPTVSTLSDESGAKSAPADLSNTSKTDSALDDEHATDQPTLVLSGNGNGAHRAGAAAETAAGAHRSQRDSWQRLNAALGDDKIAVAFQAVIEVVESQLGLTEVGLRAARLAFAPLPDRRRRVLDDLRRMQGRSDLKASIRKRNAIGILTQNIGVTLGLGLAADGSLRALADRADYTAIGGLAVEYGTEAVWLAVCAIAGQSFEGDPIEYLRAVLSNKRERGAGGAQTTRSFDQVDYLSEQVGLESSHT